MRDSLILLPYRHAVFKMGITYIFEIIGTLVFAISGALAAGASSGKNWFGVLFVGFVTAIGGGSFRDILLGSYPLVWVEDVNFIYAVILGIILMRLFYKPKKHYVRAILLFDTMGIALFTVLGTDKALNLGNHVVIAAIMGMFTAVMGGVFRDTLTNETPVIFRKEIYATACLAGATLFLALDYLNFNREWNLILSGVFIIVFRLLSIYYKWSIPKFSVKYD